MRGLRRQGGARCRLRRRHPGRGDGGARRDGHRHRPVGQGAQGRRAAPARKPSGDRLPRASARKTFAERHAGAFDVVTCMELLEHVPEPASMVAACARLVRPGGQVFFSTINRNPKSYLFAVIGAEYVLRLLPKGTHDYARFIKPSELARWCRESGAARRRADRHDLQPADARLPARQRLRRELPAALRP